jgi:hypothetical protein
MLLCFILSLLNISKYTTFKPIARVVLLYIDLAMVHTLYGMFQKALQMITIWRHKSKCPICSYTKVIRDPLWLRNTGLDQRFSTQFVPRPVFLKKKFPRPTIEIFWPL